MISTNCLFSLPKPKTKMVVPAAPTSMQTTTTKPNPAGIPTIDLSAADRQSLSKLLVAACEDYGFFKLINHGVPHDSISRVEEEGLAFFSKPPTEKLAAASANPPDVGYTTRFGYGVKNIGLNGDMGEIEYLLLSADPISVSQLAPSISPNPSKFSSAVNDYIQAVKNVACEVLDLLAEGLWISDKSIFSRMISDVQSDSLLRINHYRPFPDFIQDYPDHPQSNLDQHDNGNIKMGFGEHSDPQILTILRSNDVGGLQISLDDGSWVPIPPDPTAYYIMIGDLFQVLTNGRFVSLKHRAMANRGRKPRMSMAYFATPSLDAWISPLPEMLTPPHQQSLYNPFTWGQYKSHIYSLRLGAPKLDPFKIKP